MERHVRQPDNTWLPTEFRGLAATIEFASMPVKIALSDIYRGVEFPGQNDLSTWPTAPKLSDPISDAASHPLDVLNLKFAAAIPIERWMELIEARLLPERNHSMAVSGPDERQRQSKPLAQAPRFAVKAPGWDYYGSDLYIANASLATAAIQENRNHGNAISRWRRGTGVCRR